MSKIIKIKLPKGVVGTKVPFDLIYLITRDQRELVHQLFDFALVMPFETSFQELVYTLFPKHYSERGFERNDATLKLTISKEIQNETQSYTTRNKRKSVASTWWAAMVDTYDLKDRLVVIPLLLRQEQEKLLPRYLGTKTWMERQYVKQGHARRKTKSVSTLSAEQVKTLLPVLSDLAYLATPYPAPNDKLRPICSVCPRSFQHLQGQCIPGMPVCYQHFDLSTILAPSQMPTTPEEPLY